MRPPKVYITARQLETLRKWATAHRDTISAVRIFGSRVSGRVCSCSDVDIAVTLRPLANQTIYTTYFFESDGWEKELSSVLGRSVDLQLHWSEFENTQRFCRRASVIVWPLRYVEAVGEPACGPCTLNGRKLDRLPRMIHKSRRRWRPAS